MKTILFILVEFPPFNSAGVYRPLRFINAAVNAGYKVLVIAPKNDDILKWPKQRIDEGLLTLINSNVTIYRVPFDDIKNLERTKVHNFMNTYFNVTDKFGISWKRNIWIMLPEIFQKYRPDLIFISLPPFSIGKLANEISKKYNTPLIVDMRDAWSQLAITPNASYVHYIFKYYQEKRIFQNAKFILSVTPQLIKSFKGIHRDIDKKKYHLIYNSTDTKIINFSSKLSTKSAIELLDIHIGYIGAFYFDLKIHEMKNKKWWRKKIHHNFFYLPVKEDWLYRSPYFFLLTLKIILRNRPDWRGKIHFHHIGDTPDWLYEMVEKMNGDIIFISHGYVGQSDIKGLAQNFDYLLATSEKVIGAEHYCLPSKLFTYINLGKPVIGFVTEGVQKYFIENSGIGFTFDPDRIKESAVRLEELLEKGAQLELNKKFISQFDSEFTNKQFLDVLESF